MSKPLLLSSGQGKVQELVGTATGQTVVWSEGPDEWVLGTPSSSGGGGVTWYLNENTTAGSPTTNLPTGASGVMVKNLSSTADGTSTTATSTASLPVFPAAPEIIAGFVTDATVPGLTGIPAGLWDFNIWAQANGNTTRQSYIQFKVYKYDGSTAPTLLAFSVPVYLYDPDDVTQYTASVLIPAGTSLLATDRIYVEVVGGSTTANRQITLHFGNGEPSHVHTTIQVPVNLATGVTGTLPVANGGTNNGSLSVTQGTVYYGDGSKLVGLAPGTNGQFLQSQGAAAPQWAAAGGGGVTSVTSSTTLSGLTLSTATGTTTPAISLTGTLGVGGGGTGVTTLTSNALLVGGATVGGLSGSASGQLARWNNTSGAWVATALAGTTNQITVTSDATSTTLSLPQDITSGSTPTFVSLILSGALGLPAAQGGPGNKSYEMGDMLYASTTTQLSKLTMAASGNVLTSSVTSSSPGWGKVALSGAITHITGTLPVGNGGTGATTLTGYVKGSGTSALTASSTVPASDLTGQVNLTNGGTNASLTATAGGAVYGTGAALAVTLAGTSGQFLKSNGASAPTWADVTATAPYDISGEVVGTPTAGATILRFVAVRAFTLSSAVVARFACTTGPTSTATFTVNHVTGGVTTSKGTVTVATSATSGTGTLTSTLLAAGDYITVVATTPAAIVDVWFTLPGTV